MMSEKTEMKKENNHFSCSFFPKLSPYNNVKKAATSMTTTARNQAIYWTQWGQYLIFSMSLSETLGIAEMDTIGDSSVSSTLHAKIKQEISRTTVLE